MKQKEYRVIITEPVQEWIDGLIKYSYTLNVNDILSIEKDLIKVYNAIFSLERFPYRIKCVNEEYAGGEVRRIWTDKYFIYFRICEEAGVVEILGITYQKGNQIEQLKHFEGVREIVGIHF